MAVIFHRKLISTLGFGSLNTTKNILASVRCIQCTDPKRWKVRLPEKHLHYGNLSRNSVLIFNHITINKLPYKYNVIKCSIPVANYCNIKQTDKEVPGSSCEPKKLSLFQRMKAMTKDYWHVLIPIHVVTSAGWFIVFYLMVKNGVDLVKILEFLHFNEKYLEMVSKSDAGNWALSYVLYKAFTPFRYALTLGATRMAIKRLSKLGIVKPFPLTVIIPKATELNKTKPPDKTSIKTRQQNEPPKS